MKDCDTTNCHASACDRRSLARRALSVTVLAYAAGLSAYTLSRPAPIAPQKTVPLTRAEAHAIEGFQLAAGDEWARLVAKFQKDRGYTIESGIDAARGCWVAPVVSGS